METLLELKQVSKSFSLGKVHKTVALNEINLEIYKGETLGLVGESGCGKSTLARVIMGVHKPSFGEVFFHGNPLKLDNRKERKQFAKYAQMVFQDPYMSLDPYMTIESIVGENLEIHGMLNKNTRKERIGELLEMTGLPKAYMSRFPHEFSGGQRQRIGIARALSAEPEFLICDEPISALDVSIQSQIINLLMELKKKLGLTYLFIAHDLNIVHYFSDRIAVMYAGKIVEIGTADEVYNNPRHPYTKVLLHAVLAPKPDKSRLEGAEEIRGDVIENSNCRKGCPFAERCTISTDYCIDHMPELKQVGESHLSACFIEKSAEM